jgi:hypothetical protein
VVGRHDHSTQLPHTSSPKQAQTAERDRHFYFLVLNNGPSPRRCRQPCPSSLFSRRERFTSGKLLRCVFLSGTNRILQSPMGSDHVSFFSLLVLSLSLCVCLCFMSTALVAMYVRCPVSRRVSCQMSATCLECHYDHDSSLRLAHLPISSLSQRYCIIRGGRYHVSPILCNSCCQAFECHRASGFLPEIPRCCQDVAEAIHQVGICRCLSRHEGWIRGFCQGCQGKGTGA